jgi:hypothetical protein
MEAEIANLVAETGRLIAETSRINKESQVFPWLPIVLAILGNASVAGLAGGLVALLLGSRR